jgi:hypothetical protein
MLPPRGWQYQHIDRSRSELLMRTASLEQLAAEVFAGVVIDDIRLREPCDEAKREKLIAHRVTFSLRPVNEAASEAADRLLNGAYGLRAHYCYSPEEGSNANRTVCHSLVDAIQARTIRSNSTIPGQEYRALLDALGGSLAKSSAKIWFDPPTDKRPPKLEDGEIVSDIWGQSRVDRKRVELALPELSAQQIEASLAKGRSVPRPLALDVKAAFTGPGGVEYIPVSKKTRSVQIHLMGWT